jgi:hypothetical protein
LKLVCNVNIIYGNLKSENSQDYAQKPQRSCTFMNSASGCVHSLFSEYKNCTEYGDQYVSHTNLFLDVLASAHKIQCRKNQYIAIQLEKPKALTLLCKVP